MKLSCINMKKEKKKREIKSKPIVNLCIQLAFHRGGLYNHAPPNFFFLSLNFEF